MNDAPHVPARRSTLAVILMSAIGSTIFATGLLVIVCTIAAAVQGYSLVELYSRYFPTFRSGGHAPPPLPQTAYVIFFAYVFVAAQLGIAIRRSLSR